MTNIPLRPIERSLPIALLRARERVMGPVRDMLAASQISEQKWRVLRVVDQAGPLEQTVIAEKACLLLPSLSRLLNAMEADGQLTRTPSTQDKRKSMITITDQGRALIQQHAPESRQLFADLEAEFGKENLEQLLDLLEKLQAMKL